MRATLHTVWKWARWPVYVGAGVLAAAIAILIWRIVVLTDTENTNAAVDRIHASRLQWSDVNGELPPEPDAAENAATLAGVDSNGNGIRDDVERAIYLKYRDTPKLALAMLQYAKALQKELTDVYNSKTLVAVIQEEGRASVCILDISKDEEVDSLVFNTESRRKFREEIFKKFMTSYSLLDAEGSCDISL